MGKLAPHLSFANVTSVVALVMALGLGSAWAATEIGKNEVTSKAIKNGQVKGADLANDAVTSPKVGDGSLLAQDFAAGELPAGERGPAGPTGPDGPRGETGIQGPPGAPNPNAETLDGFDSSGFVRYGSTIPSGTTVRGTFGVFADDHDSGQSFSTTGRTFISLPAVAPVPLTNANVNLRAGSGLGDADPQCIDQGSDKPDRAARQGLPLRRVDHRQHHLAHGPGRKRARWGREVRVRDRRSRHLGQRNGDAVRGRKLGVHRALGPRPAVPLAPPKIRVPTPTTGPAKPAMIRR